MFERNETIINEDENEDENENENEDENYFDGRGKREEGRGKSFAIRLTFPPSASATITGSVDAPVR